MILKGHSYRLVKYLSLQFAANGLSHNKLKHQLIPLDIQLTYDTIIAPLRDARLITTTMNDITITGKGREAIRETEDRISNIAFTYLHEDFFLAVLHLLHNENWGMRIEEFPNNMLEENTESGTGSKEFRMRNYLYAKREFINNTTYKEYTLNSEGERHYSQLLKRYEKKRAEHLQPKLKIGQIGDNVFGKQNKTGDNSTINESSITDNSKNETVILETLLTEAKSRLTNEEQQRMIANDKLIEAQTKLALLQIQESKNKKLYAFIGWIAGIVSAVIVAYILKVLELKS